MPINSFLRIYSVPKSGEKFLRTHHTLLKVRGCIFEVFTRGHGSACGSVYEGFCESCGMLAIVSQAYMLCPKAQKNSAAASFFRVDVY